MTYTRHILTNFDKKDPLWKRAICNLLFQFVITKIPFRQSQLTENDLQEVKKMSKGGDVVLVGQHHRFSHFLIPGVITHAVLYTGDGVCVHAVADGVCEITLGELIKEYDTLILVRPSKIEESSVCAAIDYAKKHIGTPFNFFFQPGTQHYYCSQLVNDAFHHAGFHTRLPNNTRSKRRTIRSIIGIQNPLHPFNFTKGAFDIVYSSKEIK